MCDARVHACQREENAQVEVLDGRGEGAVRIHRDRSRGVQGLSDVDSAARPQVRGTLDIAPLGGALDAEHGRNGGMRVSLERDAEEKHGGCDDVLVEQHIRERWVKEWKE